MHAGRDERRADVIGRPEHDGAVTTMSQDESALAAAEERARLAEERAAQTETAFEVMTDGVVLYDAAGRITRMNAAARTIFAQAAPADFPTLPIAARVGGIPVYGENGQLMPPDDWPGCRVLRGELLSGADAMDVAYRTLDGQDVWINVTGAPTRAADGRITGGIVVYHDVTERRQLERRTNEVLNALLAIAEVLVQEPTQDGAGDRARAKHGPTRGLPVAQRLAQLTCSVLGCSRVGISVVEPESQLVKAAAVVGLTPEQEPRWWAEQEQQQVRFGERAASELRARFAAGEALVIDMTRPPYNELPNPYGVTTSLVVPMRIGERMAGILSLDYGGPPHAFTREEMALAEAVGQLSAFVIERERLLRERAAAEARVLALESANARMDQFLSIASHELRTPVTVIKVNMQLLVRQTERLSRQQGVSGQRVAKEMDMLRRTERQVDRLARLVEDLVDISRIRLDKLELRPESFDLAGLVREAVESQRLAEPERAITLEVPENDPAPVLADADRVGQVLTNYLTNALKYSQATQPVAVQLRIEGNLARVSVCDQGPGIPPDEQAHIWEVFHRVPSIEVQSGSGVGLGLGLHISRTIVERHGGQVGVESAPGEGSTFWFTLPLARDAAQA
jgi:signal transduction histidine kinase/PAS domain-containing protein